MNLYNFILDRDKLLLPIKARNFIWFLRALRVCLAMALNRFCLKILGWQVACLFWKENIQNLTICKTFIHGNHYTGGSSGMEGWARMGGEACSGFWCWPPRTLSLQVELYSSSIYKQALFLLPPHPTEHRPEWPVAPWREPRAGCACVRGAVVGRLPGGAPFLSVICAWRRLELLWEQFGLENYIWFLFLLFWITILPIPSCLPPS